MNPAKISFDAKARRKPIGFLLLSAPSVFSVSKEVSFNLEIKRGEHGEKPGRGTARLARRA